MGKYNKSNKNNIFKEEPEISVSEHSVLKNGKKMKMVIPEGKIGYGDTESHAQMAADLATKHSEDTKAGEKVLIKTGGSLERRKEALKTIDDILNTFGYTKYFESEGAGGVGSTYNKPQGT